MSSQESVLPSYHMYPPSSDVLSPKTPIKSNEKTILYLAYGSNLAAETFRGQRKVQPLRSINVVVPTLQLVFDLPGLPYKEPCFANSRPRGSQTEALSSNDEKNPLIYNGDSQDDSDLLGWHKGLVGVVYEVSETDYARIIATEGGGTSYLDIEVECYELPKESQEVPFNPIGNSFKAHTLYANTSDQKRAQNRVDGWAEPSPRYLNLITTGALEHDLPLEYRRWLEQLKAFRITTKRQRLGEVFFVVTWGPPVLFLFILSRLLADKNGKIPTWLGLLVLQLFSRMWSSYDLVFKKVFGEGERTIGDPLSRFETT